MLADLYLLLAGVGAAIAGVAIAWLRGRAAGRRIAQARNDRQTLERIEAGQGAARKAARDDRTPEQILRDNDGSW